MNGVYLLNSLSINLFHLPPSQHYEHALINERTMIKIVHLAIFVALFGLLPSMFCWGCYSVIQDAETYKLGYPSNYHYLNQSKTYELDGVSNAEEYVKTRRAMDIVGISDDEQVCWIKFVCNYVPSLSQLGLVFINSLYAHQEAIFRTLAGILHLGNVDFSPGKEHDSSAIKNHQSNFHLQMAADLFR